MSNIAEQYSKQVIKLNQISSYDTQLYEIKKIAKQYNSISIYPNKLSIKNLYIINGLQRAGNHLLISWLISGINNEEKTIFLNSVYFIDTFYKKKSIPLSFFMNRTLVSNDNFMGMLFDSKIREKLHTTKDCIQKILQGKITNLVISLENDFSSSLYIISNIFKSAKSHYKILVVRDILNLLASTIKKNIIRNKNAYDSNVLCLWDEHISNFNNESIIIYNYNKFIYTEKYRIELAKKLFLNYDNTIITVPLFGYGSSFKQGSDVKQKKEEYYTRWIKYAFDINKSQSYAIVHNKQYPIYKQILKNNKYVKILKEYFDINIAQFEKGIIYNHKNKIKFF